MDKKDSVQKIIDKSVEEGGVLAVMHFDINATTKETVQSLGTALVQKILTINGVLYASGEIEEPIENDGMLSSPVKVTVLGEDFPAIARVTGNFCPYSVEINRPDTITMNVPQSESLLMDVSQNNFELKKTIIEKVSGDEDRDRFRKELKARDELGRRAISGKPKSAG